MKKLSLLALLALTTLGACSTPHALTAEGLKVKIAKHKKTKCSVIGKFKGTDEKGSVELARNQAVNMAADKGATNVYFDEEVNNGSKWVVQAIGYICR